VKTAAEPAVFIDHLATTRGQRNKSATPELKGGAWNRASTERIQDPRSNQLSLLGDDFIYDSVFLGLISFESVENQRPISGRTPSVVRTQRLAFNARTSSGSA
jgi:hypothetical protein